MFRGLKKRVFFIIVVEVLTDSGSRHGMHP